MCLHSVPFLQAQPVNKALLLTLIFFYKSIFSLYKIVIFV